MQDAEIALAEVKAMLREGGWDGDDVIAGVRGLVMYAEDRRLEADRLRRALRETMDDLTGAGGLTMNGAERIAAERKRQVAVEGWTPEHDDTHDNNVLLRAAECYLWAAKLLNQGVHVDSLTLGSGGPNRRDATWPWRDEFWKPSADPVRNLEKAGALIAAEIDRLLRKRDDDMGVV